MLPKLQSQQMISTQKILISTKAKEALSDSKSTNESAIGKWQGSSGVYDKVIYVNIGVLEDEGVVEKGNVKNNQN